MKIGNLFQAFKISAAGLSAQRARLNVVSSNIANAQTTRTAEGGPYRRRTISFAAGPGGAPGVFEKLLRAKESLGLEVDQTSDRHLADVDLPTFQSPAGGVTYQVGVDADSPTRREYAPGHPDADAEGYVEYPNVEVIREMVDLLSATRAYEANVTVLQSTKSMLKKALEI